MFGHETCFGLVTHLCNNMSFSELSYDVKISSDIWYPYGLLNENTAILLIG
jgi:hypothetical protein